MDPEPRKKQLANIKKKDKGNPYASQKHVRIELENQYRHSKRVNMAPPSLVWWSLLRKFTRD